MADTPEREGPIVPGAESAGTLARIEALEKETEHLKRSINFVSDTNKFILVVLFAAFLVIIVAIGIAVITSIHTHVPGPTT